MGSKTGEHPDDILKQNHKILAAVHSGRSELMPLFLFANSSGFLVSLLGSDFSLLPIGISFF